MAHIHTGQLTATKEWAKHQHPWWKRDFWKRERKAGRVDAATRLAE